MTQTQRNQIWTVSRELERISSRLRDYALRANTLAYRDSEVAESELKRALRDAKELGIVAEEAEI